MTIKFVNIFLYNQFLVPPSLSFSLPCAFIYQFNIFFRIWVSQIKFVNGQLRATTLTRFNSPPIPHQFNFLALQYYKWHCSL